MRAVLFDPVSGDLARGDEALIARWQSEPQTLLWLDIAKHDPAAEKALLETTFGLHPLAVQDALRERHPPKIESFANALFILLRGLDADSADLDFGVIQLALFVGERFLITRHNKFSLSVDWLWAEVERQPACMGAGSGALALGLTNRVVRRYLDIVLALEPRLDEIENEIFARPQDRLLAELTRYKSRLRQLARIANYHLVIAKELRRDSGPFIDRRLAHEITDVYDQLERTQSLAALYYEAASDLTAGYLAVASHRLNQVMQILTVFTVIFVPLTFLAGIYGMNFDYMPELHSHIGYFVLIGVMLVVAVLQLIYFRRKGWL